MVNSKKISREPLEEKMDCDQINYTVSMIHSTVKEFEWMCYAFFLSMKFGVVIGFMNISANHEIHSILPRWRMIYSDPL